MRLRLLALAAIVLCPGGAALSQEWVEYVNLPDRFAMIFPGMPEVEETTRMSAHDVVFPARVYTLDDGNSHYALTVVDYTEAETRHRERPDQTDASSGARFWVMDVRASMAHEAQQIRERVRATDGEITYEGWVDIDKIEGHQMQFTHADGSRSFVAIHLNASRLYILEGTSPAGFPPPAWFQQSLRFLDEEGRRIRYTFDTDGQRIDIRVTDLADVQEGVTKVIVE